MTILINYKYEYYPFTTASYFEMAAKSLGHQIFRTTDTYDPEKIDFVLNVEPVDNIVRIPGKPCVYYEIDNHVIQGYDHHFYKDVDLVLLAQPRFAGFYEDYKTGILPLAAWPAMHKLYADEPIRYDIGFIGNDTYPYRHKLLNLLNDNFKLLRTNSEPGEPYSRLLSQCKLTFNCSMQGDVNMRFFEAMATGRLLLTDYLPEQDMFAEAGRHYIAFDDEDDLVSKVKYFLKNDQERNDRGFNASCHVHEYHSYTNRLTKLICLVNNLKS